MRFIYLFILKKNKIILLIFKINQLISGKAMNSTCFESQECIANLCVLPGNVNAVNNISGTEATAS